MKRSLAAPLTSPVTSLVIGLVISLVICAALFFAPASLAHGNPAANAAINYNNADTWLCRPGRAGDACDINLDTTIVAADGTLTVEPYKAAADPAFDCFYVYPTVSNDPGGNSDMTVGAEELSVIKAQFARFGQVCRTYAPLYRQVTLTALRARMVGQKMEADRQLGYGDVAAAWAHYLEHDNKGRGVVLIGHSQGSGMLQQLIMTEIDGKPVQKKIISALLTGSRVAVPKGKTIGGAFKHMPLCTAASQSGCIVTFAAFRSDAPPPADSLFGRVPGENMAAACTNPADLGAKDLSAPAALHAYMPTGATIVADASENPAPWTTTGQKVTTPFVSLPGMLSAHCQSTDTTTWLSITVNGNPDDPRVDDITGDVVNEGVRLTNWGLHLIDMNLAMGNLLAMVQEQYQNWAEAQ